MDDTSKQFLKDVISGLSKPIKKLPSKYFYDEYGDKLFQKIMKLPEYYLPEAELEILNNKALDLIEGFDHLHFDIAELGPGDGSKTIHFLEILSDAGKNFTYCPLDISSKVLAQNIDLVKKKIPDIRVNPIAGDYFETLSKIDRGHPKIILFMGSNIGNYENGAAIDFLKKIKSFMQKGDRILMGIDLKKNPKTILKAYDDEQGITKQFNLNLLERINRELGGDFDIETFDHYPFYDPIRGMTYSFLFSLQDQVVSIDEQKFHFRQGEIIHTEISQKYDLKQIEEMGVSIGLPTVKHHLDSRQYFTISTFS